MSHARPQFVNPMKEEYPALADQISQQKCGVCHFGSKKANRNDYGKAMAEALGEKNLKDVEKIKASLKKIETEKSSVEGKTFGDLIKDGKLPGTAPQ